MKQLLSYDKLSSGNYILDTHTYPGPTRCEIFELFRRLNIQTFQTVLKKNTSGKTPAGSLVIYQSDCPCLYVHVYTLKK